MFFTTGASAASATKGKGKGKDSDSPKGKGEKGNCHKMITKLKISKKMNKLHDLMVFFYPNHVLLTFEFVFQLF